MNRAMAAQRLDEASKAIRYHYDVGNDFYELWLDKTLSYSCAIWADSKTLDAAQENKIAYHLDAIGAPGLTSVLDIGCGWGGVLGALELMPGIKRAMGLTLSDAQADFIQKQGYSKVTIEVKNWQEFQPVAPFDGIISIGAFEHFATPTDSVEEKIAIYRSFFASCRDWLAVGGRLSLQTIAYGSMHREQASSFFNEQIFPNADLPTLAEIAQAADGLFEIQRVENGRLDYAKTCEAWYRRLSANKAVAVEGVGEAVVARYLRYLKMSAYGFQFGKIQLLRLQLQALR
ncbi:class I SAM-dependent methyltransferase [Pseudomonas sp. FEN]|uniref:class I SAM-dependent methyltransferase n=1 Tax=Pseudomonas sp. FEN TaxID=2767468 RepID=UPI00174CFBAD|nr:class I SAM-dependent methyltransferase [Pseudomonas sp. FEN]CAD5200341.1 Cyclopropane-fatty-acyl-phospholipid synthase (EC 2.1.1.79) [Pseudomonas sp. FEN]